MDRAENDGRKLDHKTLEVLRSGPSSRSGKALTPKTWPSRWGCTARRSTAGWRRNTREGGKDALAARPVPGRPPKLAGPQLARLYALIAGQDPRQMQFEFALWTREMVREVIRRGVRLSVVSAGPALAQARALAAAAAAPRLSAEPRGGRAVEARE